MSLASFAYAISIFWLILYGLQRLLRHKKQQGSILPSHRHSFIRNDGRISSDWHITIRFLQARIETSRLNETHDKLLNRLKKRKNDSWSRVWLERFYTFGYVSGVIGMVVALGLLVWTTWTLVKPVSIHKIVEVSKSVGKLMKRDVQKMNISYEEFAPESPITPILPGVTVPLNHVPFIISALFISQIVHELGHAIAGALYGIPILSSGASIIVCIPAAFVSFSTTTLDTLRPTAKSRIISAGPFHNLLFWCFWFLAGYIGGGIFCILLGYKDVSSLGRVVLNVEDESPLAGYLATGAIITKLNDHSMASSPTDPDPWNSFLKSVRNDEMNLGWCVSSEELGSSSKECCLPDGNMTTSLSCFMANTIPSRVGCLDPIPILTSTDVEERCASESGCKEGNLCVRPAEKEALLRLTMREGAQPEKVVLWSGPRREIWDEVTVGKWLPRLSFLPISLPLWTSIFWEYLLTVNLSLFLFNLIPLGNLDGLHFLRSILTSTTETNTHEVYDLEALGRADAFRGPDVRRQSRYRLLEKGISGGVALLVALDTILLMFALIRI